MKKEKQKVSQSRRKFLRDAATTGSATAAVLTVPGALQADTELTEKPQKQEEGYRLTQHILDYYKGAAS